MSKLNSLLFFIFLFSFSLAQSQAQATLDDLNVEEQNELYTAIRAIGRVNLSTDNRAISKNISRVKKAFPTAVKNQNGKDIIDHQALNSIFIATLQDLIEDRDELNSSNDHLSDQLYHVMLDKADLERSIHSLEIQTAELQKSMNSVLKHIKVAREAQAGN